MSRKGLFGFVIFIGLFALAVRPAVDPDLGWHLRSGELIAGTHHVPHQDPFSFTYAGAPWTAHEWLSDLTMYGLWRLGGTAALILFFAALIVLAFAFLYARCEARPYAAGLLLFWGALVTVPSWGVRPQIFTLLLASLFLWVLDRSLQTARGRWLAWLPALMALWVNLHAGFAIGVVLILLYAAAALVESKLYQAKQLAIAAAASVAVIPLNPNGFRLFAYPFQTLLAPSMMQYIQEWFSPDFHRGIYRVFLLFIVFTLIVLARSPRRPTVREGLLLLFGLAAALTSARHIPFFVLIAVPILSRRMPESLFSISSSSPDEPQKTPRAALHTAIAVLALCAAGLQAWSVIRHQTAAELAEFPVAATDFLQNHRGLGRTYNDYNWGGYLIARGLPVFVDGRADLYGDAFLHTAVRVNQARPGWDLTLEHYGVRTALIERKSALATVLRESSGWQSVFEDERSAVFTRRDEKAVNAPK